MGCCCSSPNTGYVVSAENLEKDLSGKIIIITGAKSGCGFECAKQLAKQGATLVLGVRKHDQCGDIINEIIGDSKANVKALELDLSEKKSVIAFVESFKAEYEKLDVLVNNAGIMACPERRNSLGYEMQFATNHLGHFLLTALLVDMLAASQDPRVVTIASSYHYYVTYTGRHASIDFDDINFENKDGKGRAYDEWDAYGASKLANVMFAKELANRSANKITSVSVHPGWVRSALMRHAAPECIQSCCGCYFRSGGMIEPWEGIQTHLHCILDDDIAKHNGGYFMVGSSPADAFGKGHPGNKGGWPLATPSEQANDDKACSMLWTKSNELLGIGADVSAPSSVNWV